ncbi:MAG TPA: OmpH family outer membrane protein [Chthoniobacterales bacterium]|jgi:outer membrane protein|nr:OmpH family outer membrane protein [Chthoniobacterales bacterium]
MKKILLLTAAAALIFPAVSYADLKVGTVDMNRCFKEYNKTKDSEKKINEAKDAAKKEYDDRAENYKKALDEINKLNQQLDSPALSADKKTSMAKDRDDKIANIKNMEREINEFRQTRERQLQEQAMRMRENIVKEITDVIAEKVKGANYDLVLDKTGPSMNGVNVVLHSKDSFDFTTDVITALNKKPVTTTTEKPATSPATTTTTTSPAASSPKKP